MSFFFQRWLELLVGVALLGVALTGCRRKEEPPPKTPLPQRIKERPPPRRVDTKKQKACREKAERLQRRLLRARRCWKDSHCVLIHYGCPFPCQGAVRSRHVKKLNRLVARYRKRCGKCKDFCQPLPHGAPRCRTRICVVLDPKKEKHRRQRKRFMKRCGKMMIRYHRIRRRTYPCRRDSDCMLLRGHWPLQCFEGVNRRLHRRYHKLVQSAWKRYVRYGCPVRTRSCPRQTEKKARCLQGRCTAFQDDDD